MPPRSGSANEACEAPWSSAASRSVRRVSAATATTTTVLVAHRHASKASGHRAANSATTWAVCARRRCEDRRRHLEPRGELRRHGGAWVATAPESPRRENARGSFRDSRQGRRDERPRGRRPPATRCARRARVMGAPRSRARRSRDGVHHATSTHPARDARKRLRSHRRLRCRVRA